MLRFPTLALLVLTAIASFACTPYTTGLQKTVARADEAAVIAALHSISVAEQTYALSNGGNYGTLDQLRDGGFLDVRFSSPNGGIKDYSLTITPTPAEGGVAAAFSCNADPTKTGPQAGRHFYMDSTSEAIHVNATQPATSADPLY